MKPLQIGLLVIAGALSGAVVMKVWQRPQTAAVPAAPPAAAPAVAQVQTPPPAASPATAKPEPITVLDAPAAPAAAAPAAAPRGRTAHFRSAHSSKPAPVSGRAARAVRHTAPPVLTARGGSRPSPARASAPVAAPPAATAPAPTQPAAPVTQPAPQIQTPPTPPARTEPENVTPPPPPAPDPQPLRVTLNAGMLIPVRLVDGLSSERSAAGDVFTATLTNELAADGYVIAERGARVEGRVTNVDRAGKVRGVATMAVELTRIRTSDGQWVTIHTDAFEKRAEPTQSQDAAKVAGGAAVGAIVGAIAGGGKGAAIGAGVGGGAGAGDVLLTRGKAATLPSETRVSFRLRTNVTVTEQR